MVAPMSASTGCIMTVTIELDAETRLAELVAKTSTGDDVIITQAGRPVAKLVSTNLPPRDREPGSAKGLFVVPDDFDAPLDDLRDYM